MTSIKTHWSSSKLLLMIYVVILSGCFDHTADIQQYIKAVKSSTLKISEAEPEAKNFSAIKYASNNVRDPFFMGKTDRLTSNTSTVLPCLSPNTHHQPEVLEGYALSDLVMRGTLGDARMLWALLEATDSTLHRVTVGHYIGLDKGVITEVSRYSVKIVELTFNGLGCWLERKTQLSLINSG